MLRREFLGLACAMPAYVAPEDAQLSLLPLYGRENEPVRRSYIQAAAAALMRVYRVRVVVRDPQRYDGAFESEVLLDYIGRRPDLTMAVISNPLRTPGRSLLARARYVSGIGDLPTEDRARPRGSIVTTSELEGRPSSEVERWLCVVAVHEFGHNLGAWDCNNRSCYMHYEIEFPRGSLPRQFCGFHKTLLDRALKPTP